MSRLKDLCERYIPSDGINDHDQLEKLARAAQHLETWLQFGVDSTCGLNENQCSATLAEVDKILEGE